MNSNTGCTQIELIYIIVNFGLAPKIVKYAKMNGITGSTVFLGKGTINNPILDFLALNEARKEIILMAAKKDIAYEALEHIAKKFNFDKRNHGIAFTTSIINLVGTCMIPCDNYIEQKGVEDSMYHAIFVVVDRGKGETVIEAATSAGSKGATIINARGSGIHETCTLFSMEIELEKEIVLIISENHLTESITSTISGQLEINKPGNGIIFIQNVNKAYGLHSKPSSLSTP